MINLSYVSCIITELTVYIFTCYHIYKCFLVKINKTVRISKQRYNIVINNKVYKTKNIFDNKI